MKGCLVSFNLTIFIEPPIFNANSVDPDQTPRSAASDLGLHRRLYTTWCVKSVYTSRVERNTIVTQTYF